MQITLILIYAYLCKLDEKKLNSFFSLYISLKFVKFSDFFLDITRVKFSKTCI